MVSLAIDCLDAPPCPAYEGQAAWDPALGHGDNALNPYTFHLIEQPIDGYCLFS